MEPSSSCKVLVLNLERSRDRRARMSNELSKLGLPYEFVSATDGMSLSKVELNKYSEDAAIIAEGRALSRGEIGCALSHLKLYERLLASTDECYLILEDDVQISPELIEVLKRRNHFPKNWEFINFLTDTVGDAFGEPIFDKYRMTTFSDHANRNAVYLVNRTGAKKLLESAFPIRYPADGLTGRCELTGLISYGIQPSLATLHDVQSTIQIGKYRTIFYRFLALFGSR